MRSRTFRWRTAGAVASGVVALASSALAGDWRRPDPENTLVVDTSKGRIVVEMQPELAPKSVERVKLLAREGVYDGLLFHRVLAPFAQTGNPNNRDGGVSNHPNLPAEFRFKLPAEGGRTTVGQRSDGEEAFIGASPVIVMPWFGGGYVGWGAYCAGVVGMGRQKDVDTGNSEIFFMSRPLRYLDHDYSVWGRVVSGLDVVRSLEQGEPPAHPDRMVRVRVAADLRAADRPQLEVADEHGPAFRREVEALKRAKGAAFSVCDVEIKVRAAVTPEVSR